MAWKPIDSVPKGVAVLLYEDGHMYKGALNAESPFEDDHYFESYCGQPVVEGPEPTHWMPLPDEPTDK